MAKLQELENVFVDLEYWIPAWILHLNQSKCEVVRSVEAVFVLLVILHLCKIFHPDSSSQRQSMWREVLR